MLVQDFLHNSAAKYPDKVALICGSERLTYAQINAMTNRLANALIENGVKRGDRVAIYLHNSVEAVIGIFATLKAGGVFVVVNRTTKEDKLLNILNNCRAAVLLMDGRSEKLARSIMESVASVKLCVPCGMKSDGWEPIKHKSTGMPYVLNFDSIQKDFLDYQPPSINIDRDLACLIYTSGSTGEPKGVMSDHSNVVFAASSIIKYLENRETDIVINVLPLSFDYGLYQLLMVIKFSGTLVLERTFAYPAAVLKRMQEERVTGFPGVPTLFAILLKMDLEPFGLSNLRYITNTAAALPTSHILEIRAKFPQATLYSMYGLTETKRTLYLPPEQLDIRPSSVGNSIPGTEAWIEDDQGERLPAGEIGELVVRGRHVISGYWEAPNASAARYRPGPIPGEQVCYSDDLFRMDEDGFFYFVSRKDDIIKTRGEKVAPKEVENVLHKLDGVVEAAVVGIQDGVLGEAVKAVLVIDSEGLDERKVLAHCRANLEDFMIPKYVEFTAELPKTSSGKVDKKPLK